ncbi:hypothetical protein QA811_43230 [Streptomyces sp. B21-102]
MTWNDAGQLTQVSGAKSGTTSYIYDADGNVLLQSDPNSTTLYLPGEQLTLTGTTTTGVRYLPLPGGGTVVRTGTGTNYKFQINDPHGTSSLYLDSTAQTPTWRQFTPYGGTRGTAVNWPDNRGFLNAPDNTNTGLTQLGVRQYDPTLGASSASIPSWLPPMTSNSLGTPMQATIPSPTRTPMAGKSSRVMAAAMSTAEARAESKLSRTVMRPANAEMEASEPPAHRPFTVPGSTGTPHHQTTQGDWVARIINMEVTSPQLLRAVTGLPRQTSSVNPKRFATAASHATTHTLITSIIRMM